MGYVSLEEKNLEPEKKVVSNHNSLVNLLYVCVCV